MMRLSRRTADLAARWVPPGLLALCVLLIAARVAMVLWAAHPVGSGSRLTELTSNLVMYAALLTFPVTATVILRRHPRHRIGWLLVAVGAGWTVGLASDTYLSYGLSIHPLPRPDLAAAVNGGSWVPGIGLVGTFLLLLFPDGQLPSPRWRPFARLCAGTLIAVTASIYLSPGRIDTGPRPDLDNPLGQKWAAPVLALLVPVLLGLLVVCIVGCATAAVLRYRRSVGVERLQLKWLATASVVIGVVFTVSMLAPVLAGPFPDGVEPAWMRALDQMSLLSFLLFPVSIGAALLRYRLYDIDVVINRALVYGPLIVVLAGTYTSTVLVLQVLLRPLTRQSDLAVAGSTLAVAALFRPLRARVRTAVDRRFYRSRYDARRTAEAFAGRLRNQLDLEAVGVDLQATVESAVHPDRLSLWLRPAPDLTTAAFRNESRTPPTYQEASPPAEEPA